MLYATPSSASFISRPNGVRPQVSGRRLLFVLRSNAKSLSVKRYDFLSSFRRSKSTTWRDIRRFLVLSKKAEPRPQDTAAARPADWFNRLNQHFATVGSTVADSLAAADTGRLSALVRRESAAEHSVRGRPRCPSCRQPRSAWEHQRQAGLTGSR